METETPINANQHNICNLSPSLLGDLFGFYLLGHEISAVEQTCHYLRDICQQDVIWRDRCKQEYGVKNIDGWDMESFREAYTTILHKYGWLIGVWKIDFNPYGGLMYIYVLKGCIFGEELMGPENISNIRELLIRKKWFCIKNDAKGKLETQCLVGTPKSEHEAIIIQSRPEEESPPDILIDDSSGSSTSPDVLVDEEAGETIPIMFGRLGGMRKTSALSSLLGSEIILERFNDQISSCSNQLKFSSGIFKGTYSSHGVELINVIATDEKIEGIKLTGDPNIPANKLTFKIDLSKPCVFENPDVDDETENLFERPFRLPRRYNSEMDVLPDTYIKCYRGKGHIASDGYTDPEFTDIVFCLFNNNEFGLFWKELGAMVSYFTRDNEISSLFEEKGNN